MNETVEGDMTIEEARQIATDARPPREPERVGAALVVALAEVDRLTAELAEADRAAEDMESSYVSDMAAVIRERDRHRSRLSSAAHVLIAHIGASQPEDLEETAARAAAEILRLRALASVPLAFSRVDQIVLALANEWLRMDPESRRRMRESVCTNSGARIESLLCELHTLTKGDPRRCFCISGRTGNHDMRCPAFIRDAPDPQKP